jgi:hypothetical protein
VLDIVSFIRGQGVTSRLTPVGVGVLLLGELSLSLLEDDGEGTGVGDVTGGLDYRSDEM